MFPISDTKTSGKFPYWVLGIILANIYFFYLEITSLNPEIFITQYALIPSMVNFQIPETLIPFITSQFLHAGFIHIISNMWFLWIFGDNVEDRLGVLIFPIFYLFCGAAAALTQYFFIPNSNIPMLGASGAVAGVLGAYLVFFPHHSIKTLIPIFGLPAIINVPTTIMLVYWFITQLFSGTASVVTATSDLGGVAFMAHVGGFAAGWVIAKVFTKTAFAHS